MFSPQQNTDDDVRLTLGIGGGWVGVLLGFFVFSWLYYLEIYSAAPLAFSVS
ncbi:hypothetical protein [Yersinia aldovae]|uniref:hypothetical protein n=1 Tax=Yersinia aldovae TaxID=29483 RepID=UPI0012E0C3BD|nr:hypothetical protein [Yersinia aldovae]